MLSDAGGVDLVDLLPADGKQKLLKIIREDGGDTARRPQIEGAITVKIAEGLIEQILLDQSGSSFYIGGQMARTLFEMA